MEVDYLIVGSGLTGATIARLLVDNGHDAAVLERRGHLGGNVHDHVHPSGIRVHTYGPHYFRTSSEQIWRYVGRFAQFYPFAAVLMSNVDGRLEHWPIQSECIERLAGSGWTAEHRGSAANFEQASLAMMPALIYQKFVRGYTAKQWGADPATLEPGLAGRFDVRANGDVRLKPSKYQGLPAGGYTGFMQRMLDGIRVYRGVDYLAHRSEFTVRKLLLFTGPIDEYFGFDLGRLAYRGQQRAHRYLPDIAWHQPAPQVNEPDPQIPIIRTLEWKHMMEPDVQSHLLGTVITTETPYSPSDPSNYEYPFPDTANRQLYARYRDRAEATERLLICGRLGEYRYFDMDQAIGRAMTIANRILRGHTGRQLSVE
jgi:UDP-galactopyranose mutase